MKNEPKNVMFTPTAHLSPRGEMCWKVEGISNGRRYRELFTSKPDAENKAEYLRAEAANKECPVYFRTLTNGWWAELASIVAEIERQSAEAQRAHSNLSKRKKC